MKTFNALLVAEIPHLRIRARSLTRDFDKAEDLLQTVLLRAMERCHQFELGTNFGAWMNVMMFNQFVGDGRTAKRRSAATYHEGETPVLGNQESKIQLGEALVAIRRLHPKTRQALVLVGIGGLAYAEAAQLTGDKSLGNLKSRVSRGRKLLKDVQPI